MQRTAWPRGPQDLLPILRAEAELGASRQGRLYSYSCIRSRICFMDHGQMNQPQCVMAGY